MVYCPAFLQPQKGALPWSALDWKAQDDWCQDRIPTIEAVLMHHGGAETLKKASRLSAVWQLFNFPFSHVGLLHVAFNMMAFVACGSGLERLLGMLLLLHHVLLIMLMGGAFYIAASFLLSALPTL